MNRPGLKVDSWMHFPASPERQVFLDGPKVLQRLAVIGLMVAFLAVAWDFYRTFQG
jgi:hypothetical protein